jgi:hypothetical protein
MNWKLGCLLCLTTLLFAQVESGTIVGTVTDPAGAVIPNARITLINDATKFSRVVNTNASGQYVAYSIPTGTYTITAEAAGFQKLVRSGVELTAAGTITADMKLPVGSVQESVEVRAEASLVQDQTAVISSLVTNQQIVEMPLNGRTFTSLLLMSPGTYAGSSNNLTSSPYAIRGSTNYSVNGSTPQNNSYLIDGVVNRNLWLNTLIMVPTVDSIQEFRVLTSNYSAEYGAAAGAITVVQTKSGSNAFHGSAYEFLRNDKLDANTFFNNRSGAPKPAFRRNEFGATTGGPIRRDKTFFFADYQGLRIRQPQTITSTIPTIAQRNMVVTGDFSNLGRAIFDPNGVTVRDQFPGNKIPASRLDPAAIRLIQLLPPPTSGAATRNFIFNPTLAQRTDQFDARVDHNLGASDRLFFKYSYDNTGQTVPGLLPSPANAGLPIGPYLSADGNATATGVPLVNQSGTLNYTKVIGPNIVNEARAGVVRWNEYINPLGNSFDTAAKIGIPGININNKSGGLPAFTITGFQVIGDNSTFPENSQTVSFDYEDVFTINHGSHTLKFGGLFVRNRFDGFSAFPTRGQYDFNGQFTRQIGASGSQSALADFALGAPDAVTRNILVGTFGMRYWNLGTFADDSWRVTNRLTWNFGLRYEVFAPPYEVHNRWSNFNVRTGQLVIAGSNGNDRRLRNFDRGDFAPRMGITYALTSDRKTVLRSGFGVSYVEAGQGGGQLYKNLPFFFSQVVSTDQNAAPPLLISNGLPTPVAPDPKDTAAISSGSPNAWDFNLKSARMIQWSIGLERELLSNVLLDVSYVGTRGNHLIGNININQSFPGPGAQGPRRPYFTLNPLVTNVTLRTNYGDSAYHSLQVRLEKRYSLGLTGTLAYTYSKYLADIGNINGGGNGPPQDARCVRCDWGPMPEDRRHVLVLNHVYELPFGPSRRHLNRGLLAQIAGNWNVSGIWSIQSGGHFTPSLAAAVSNSAGGGGDRPDRLSDGNLPSSQRSIDRWFDVAAFAPPLQFHFGNAGRGILVGPRYFNVDLGVHRNFRITERWNLSYRWELFNALNRPNFTEPNAAIGNPQAGQISATAAARIMQMALKLTF